MGKVRIYWKVSRYTRKTEDTILVECRLQKTPAAQNHVLAEISHYYRQYHHHGHLVNTSNWSFKKPIFMMDDTFGWYSTPLQEFPTEDLTQICAAQAMDPLSIASMLGRIENNFSHSKTVIINTSYDKITSEALGLPRWESFNF